MSRDWKQWAGQVVNGSFPLRQYLGGSDHSAVFLTERRGRDPQRAAIKLIAVDLSDAGMGWRALAFLLVGGIFLGVALLGNRLRSEA